jgi:APA family basic amino acid/polyamine antiporter
MAWIVTGALTLAAALSYGELAAMMPRAGRAVRLSARGVLAAVSDFCTAGRCSSSSRPARLPPSAWPSRAFLGVFLPSVAEDHYLIRPIHLTTGYALSLSTAQLVAVLLIALLTWSNTRGIEYGRRVQNIFTVAKTAR